MSLHLTRDGLGIDYELWSGTNLNTWTGKLPCKLGRSLDSGGTAYALVLKDQSGGVLAVVNQLTVVTAQPWISIDSIIQGRLSYL